MVLSGYDTTTREARKGRKEPGIDTDSMKLITEALGQWRISLISIPARPSVKSTNSISDHSTSTYAGSCSPSISFAGPLASRRSAINAAIISIWISIILYPRVAASSRCSTASCLSHRLCILVLVVKRHRIGWFVIFFDSPESLALLIPYVVPVLQLLLLPPLRIRQSSYGTSVWI